MATLIYDQAISAPLDRAWSTFADFGGFLTWNKLDIPLELSGAASGPGMIRTLVIPEFERVGERLDTLDHNNHELAYTLVEGKPLGMATYAAFISFTANSADKCTIHWRGEFTAVAGVLESTITERLRGSYIGMSDSLNQFLQGKPAS